MRGLFSGCESLEYLPDISKWNTENVTNISKMFVLCFSFPELSNAAFDKINDMFKIFLSGEDLYSLPDISDWKINKVIDISNLFSNCQLSSLPDLSKWNTHNVKNMSGIFYGCESLESLPDISKWNTDKITDMSEIFYGCELLESLPDISKWNTDNVTNI